LLLWCSSGEGVKILSPIPNTIEKRNILFGTTKLSSENLAAHAKSFEAEGWLSDAADFWHRAGSKEDLARLLKVATSEGDTFLFLKLFRFLSEPDSHLPDLKICAETAERLGKFRYAMKAYERLSMRDDVERLRLLLKDDGDIISENESKVFIPAAEEALEEED